VEKLLEDAGIKLSVVASDIFGVSGRDMMAALIAGQRDPQVLAGMARGLLRKKNTDLVEAFTGRFTDHHGWLLAKMLHRVDELSADIAELDERIGEQIAPFAAQAARLTQIPGISDTTARIIIAEIGVDMTRFPTAGHLASWARFAPGIKSSAGRVKGKGATGHGNRYLAAALGDAAAATRNTDTFLGERYRRLVKRRGKKRALVAVGRSTLNIVWYLLSHPEADFVDLGPDFYDHRINAARARRNHVRQLEQLGYKVTLEPVAAA
jgi:transposase